MREDPLFTNVSLPSNSRQEAWEKLGFKFGDKGTHTSRTIMSSELEMLFNSCPLGSTRLDIAKIVVEDNCLGKQTGSMRKSTFQRLSELYGLNPKIPLFRLFRYFWDADQKSHPLLALFTSLARDPILRATSPVILGMKTGEELARQQMTDCLKDSLGDRLNDNILDKVARNVSSSWTQAGHLNGRVRKKRTAVQPTPASTAYALLLGHLLGLRGQSLFQSLFARLLDRNSDELIFLAMDAKRLGLMDIKHLGGITNISFDGILTEEEKRLAYGTD